MSSDLPSIEADAAIEALREWLQKAVIGLNLCPFAKSVYTRQLIRYQVSTATTHQALMDALVEELQRLVKSDPAEIDTTLLIHPWVLNDFLDFNEFLYEANDLLAVMGLEGELQIASFHPDYRFADTAPDAIENFTNRAPYPTLHLLREASIDRAVSAFPDAAAIFERNIARMEELGPEGWRRLFEDR